MTEKRQRMISAMKYILLVIIVGYLVILMLYASGSKRAFSEVSKALSSVLDSKELVQMDDQMLKRNYGLNSADYKERFKAEYYQLANRFKGLKKMLEEWDRGKLKFSPTCPRSTYNIQLNAMADYLAILEARAVMEDIELKEV